MRESKCISLNDGAIPFRSELNESVTCLQKYISRSDSITLILSDYGPQAQAVPNPRPQFWPDVASPDVELSYRQPIVAKSFAATIRIHLCETNNLSSDMFSNSSVLSRSSTWDAKPKSNMPTGQRREQEQDQPENWSSRPPHPIKQSKQAPTETKKSV